LLQNFHEKRNRMGTARGWTGATRQKLPVAEAVEETAEETAFARERGPRRGSDRAQPGDGLVVLGPRDGINDLGLVKVLRALDLRHEPDEHAILHDLRLEAGRPVGVPLGLAPARQRYTHAVLAVAPVQVSVDTTVTEGVNHATRPKLIHTKNVAFVPERSLNASSIPPQPAGIPGTAQRFCDQVLPGSVRGLLCAMRRDSRGSQHWWMRDAASEEAAGTWR
jgi:hypothetical protein